MDDFLTDQQQADVVRKWFRENGAFLLLGLLLGLGGLFGWSQWQGWQQARAADAARLYGGLAEAVQAGRAVRAAEVEAELVADFPGSPYADQARLLMAKLHMDRNEVEQAAGYLERLLDATGDEQMQHVARLRLARVRIQQQQYESALQVLDRVDANSAFAGRYHDVRGDAYYAMGDMESARNEYEAALATVETGALDRPLVQAKLDSLGAGVPAVPVAADEPAEAVPASAD